MNYKTPMTTEESAFAAEHHSLIGKYLKAHHLSEDEFYDVAVFGYLRAVRKYLARPELRQYKFSTIANRAMSCDIHNSRKYWDRAKRSADTVPFRDDEGHGNLRDTTAEPVAESLVLEQYAAMLTPTQRRIAMLRGSGFSDREIAHAMHLVPGQVAAEMKAARYCILGLPAEESALVA